VGRLDAPFLKVLQKLRYRSEHIVHVTMECYSPTAGWAVRCRVGFMVMPLHWGLASTARRPAFQ